LKKAIFILCLIFLFQGCAMMEANRKNKEEKIEMLRKQKENYLALAKDLRDKKVGIGTSQEVIEEKYGKSEDTMTSASNVSNFALCIYEHPDASKDEAYRPIHLYYNDRKLTYWTN